MTPVTAGRLTRAPDGAPMPAGRRAGGATVSSAALVAAAPPNVPLRTVLREWGRIGLIGFGGPPAHIALLRELCVDRRGWLDAREFEDADRRLRAAAGAGVHPDGDLLRPAGAGRSRARWRAGSPSSSPASP